MPIDLTAIAAQFAGAFTAQLRVTGAQRAIGAALVRRQEAARLVDRATAGFPIVAFHNGAVTLWLPPGQRGSLTLASPTPSLVEHLVAGGWGFFTGLGRAIDPLRGDSQETVIARFLGSVDRALAEVQASVRRFETPFPAMFDPRPRTASDLFGLLALGYRALAQAATSSGEVRRLVKQLRATLGVLGMPVPDKLTRMLGPLPDSLATAPPPATRTMAETADALAREALGAVVIIGSLPSLIDWLLTEGVLGLKLWVLDAFEKVQRHVYRMRGAAFQAVFGGGSRLAQRGVLLVGAVGKVFGAHLESKLRFYRAYGTALVTGVRDFVVGLGGFLEDVAALLRALPTVLEAITRFGLDELLRAKLGWATHLIPHITLDDLLDKDGHAVNTGLRDNLQDAINQADELLEDARRKVPFIEYTEKWKYGKRQVARAHRLVDGLFTSGGSGAAIPVMPEGPPLVFHSDFPHVGETLFGEGRREAMITAVDRLERATRLAGNRVFRRVFRGMNDLAGAFTEATTRAARVDPKGRLAGLGGQADRIAASVYDPEIAAARAVEKRPREEMARAFEAWLVSATPTAGFVLIGEAIPAYVGEMASAWRAQLAEGTELTAELTPTSPHILRKRAVLGEVRMPRLTLRAAPGRELDERLADEVADQFTTAVGEAYLAGQRRVRELAAPGSPR